MSLKRIDEVKLEGYVQKLQELDINQFYILCRMHLSFVIELDTEKFEEILSNSTTKTDSKTKKTAFGLKKKGSKESLLSSGTSLTEDSVAQLSELIDFLSLPQNLEQEGLFRKTGNISRQKDLKERINNGEKTHFDNNDYSAHDCASTLKNYLGELCEPLLMDKLYSIHCQVADLACADKKVKALQLLFLLLPSINRELLKKILYLLHQVACTEANKMSADALGTMFAPQILCPRKMTGTELQTEASNVTKATSFMISNAPQLFKVPALLGFDVVQYLKENWENLDISRPCSSSSDENNGPPSRKRARSVNEDETDGTHTVVSFVDRSGTTTCDTEVALAQLYAHVQSMPESAKKRKLLKQFNRNGVGTQAEGRKHKRSRSLGESLKKRFLRNHKRQQSTHDSQDDSASTSSIGTSEFSDVFSPSTPSPYASPQVMRIYKKKVQSTTASPVRVIDLSKATNSPLSKRAASTPLPSSIADETILRSNSDDRLKVTGHAPLIKRPMMVTPDSLKPRKDKDSKFVSPISFSMKGVAKHVQAQLSTPRSRLPVDLLQTDL